MRRDVGTRKPRRGPPKLAVVAKGFRQGAAGLGSAKRQSDQSELRVPEADGGVDEGYRRMVEQTAEGAISVNPEGLILYANSPFASLVKTPLERVIGASVQSFVCASSQRALVQLLRAPADGQPRQRLDFQDSAGKTVATHCHAFAGSSGDLPTIGLLVTDLSDLLAGETALARLGAIVASASEAIIGLNSEFVITSWNRAAEDLYGYSALEAIGRSGSLIVPPDRRRQVQEANGRLRLGEKLPRHDAIHRSKSGESIPVSVSISPLQDELGQRLGSALIVHDLRGERETELQLRLAASVFESTSHGILITDRADQIVAVNRTFTQLSGFSAADLIGSPLGTVGLSEEHSGLSRQALETELHRTGSWQGELWLKRKDGQAEPIQLTMSQVRDTHGAVTHHLLLVADLSQRKADEERLTFLADHDALTGLPSGGELGRRLREALDTAARRPGTMVAVALIKLAQMQEVSDAYGHAIGDELLKAASQRMRQCLRGVDLVARYGSQEFVVVLQGPSDRDAVKTVAGKLLKALARPLVVNGNTLPAGASIGLSLFPADSRDEATLIHQAEVAMRRAVETDASQPCFYSADMESDLRQALSLDTALRRAIRARQFVLHYQPTVSLPSRRISGAEALVRWQRPGFGLVSPAEFIPVAEDRGLIVPISEWVLEEACAQACRWQAQGLGGLTVGVNISARHLNQPTFRDSVLAIIRDSGVNPRQLVLEMTENSLAQDNQVVVDTLNELRRLGVRLFIDDFGTGYSSLSYLKRLPIVGLKIDRSFVSGLPEQHDDREIVRAILGMAHGLRLSVVAEGVETERQLEWLAQEGCSEVQGFLFSRPLTAPHLMELWQETRGVLPAPAVPQPQA